ncbi:hypothetical protein ACQQ2N_07475 [Dokdonella sp. MW10]|uniref:hypothetical protein n=1 Tax=Dokdonella sp. MW10 TaxID=2992926 RepID=UPI003F818A80
MHAPTFRWPATAVLALLAACGGAAPPGSGEAIAAQAPRTVLRETPHGAFVEPAPAGMRGPSTSVPVKAPATLQRIAIVDREGFGQPLDAATIEVPAGWVAQGGVRWRADVECVGNTVGFEWAATSSDGLQAVSLMPRLAWQVDGTVVPMNPCPAAPIQTARAYLESVVRSARPQARVLAYRERADIVTAMTANAQAPANGSRMRHEAGEILVGYALQGIEMREAFVAAVTFSQITDPMIGRSVNGMSQDLIALRAPDGSLDFALLEKLRLSMRYERAWGERMIARSRQHVEAVSQRQVASIQAWHQRRMNEITMQGILERGRIRMDTIQAIGRLNDQGFANRQATNAGIHAATIDTIQEVQPWRDPTSGKQIDLSIHYRYAWQLDDGRQFLTDRADFDPQRDLGIGGHALQPVR